MGNATIYLSIISTLVIGAMILFLRMKETSTPVTRKKIIIPPIMMSTGALMYLFEPFRITPLEMIESALMGLFFSFFLIRTTKFELRGTQVFLIRSKVFLFILVGLMIVRILLKLYLSLEVDFGALSGMFWFIAFCMIIPWRVSMYLQYDDFVRENKIVEGK